MVSPQISLSFNQVHGQKIFIWRSRAVTFQSKQNSQIIITRLRKITFLNSNDGFRNFVIQEFYEVLKNSSIKCIRWLIDSAVKILSWLKGSQAVKCSLLSINDLFTDMTFAMITESYKQLPVNFGAQSQ